MEHLKFNCESASFLHDVNMRVVNDNDKLRIRSKYFLGSCAVQIVFLTGPNNSWTTQAKSVMEKKIKDGVNYLKTYTLQSNPTQTLPNMNFVFNNNPIESYCNTDPTDCFAKGDKIQLNVKKFLSDYGYFSGNMNSISEGWKENDCLQALYDYNNDQRDNANTDWAFLVFVIPYISTIIMQEVAWASEKLGLMVITDMKTDQDWVVSHETGHLFGPLDKSSGYCPNPSEGAGMYKIQNSNCGTTNAWNCFMGERNMKTVCDVTLNQLSLQKNSMGEYIAEKDFSVNTYVMGDSQIQEQNGVILSGDVIRKGKSVYITCDGNTKMHPWYNAHGPEGDVNTIVGSDHMLPSYAFSCVIGRFISVDGKHMTNWFYVGKGGQWFTTPFRGFFVFGINDKLGSYKDNSGKITIELKTRIKDQLGALWQWKMTRKNEIAIAESTELMIVNDTELASTYPMSVEIANNY